MTSKTATMTIVFTIVILAATALFVLRTIPVRNEVKGNETSIGISNAVFSEIPEEDASDLMEKSRKPLCGGYTEQREPTEEEMALFAAATGNNPEYTPLSVSTQVVAGINYRFWCRYETGDDCGHCWITIFKPLPGRGDPEVTSIEKE